jgi:hypothetical protein
MDTSGNIALQATPAYHYEPFSDDRKSNEGGNDDIPARSEMDEKRIFAAISDLFPKARERNTGIKIFYLQVQETLEWT